MRSHPSRNPWPDGSAVHCPAHRSSPGSWRYFHTWVPWSAPRRTVRPAPAPWPAGTGHWLRQIRAEGGLRRSAETPVHAAIAQDGAWVSASDCSFTNNGTALKFNTSMAYGSNPSYLNNTFTGNGVAVSIDRLPGSEVLNFAGSIFSENGTDIENKAGHPVDTANAVFE